jgi:hypothetical protein
MKNITLSNEVSLFRDSNVTLLCPHCGHFCLHHSRVDVYNRGEDDPFSMRTVCYGESSQSTGIKNVNSDENPSKRRDGIRIHFWCEGCKETPDLAIVQHKGNTFVYWE